MDGKVLLRYMTWEDRWRATHPYRHDPGPMLSAWLLGHIADATRIFDGLPGPAAYPQWATGSREVVAVPFRDIVEVRDVDSPRVQDVVAPALSTGNWNLVGSPMPPSPRQPQDVF